MIRFAKLVSFASALVLGFSVAVAHADSIETFNNTPSNYEGSECCFQVQLDQVNSKNIKVTVSLIDGATFFAKTGSGNHPGFAFDLKGDPSITVTGYDSSAWAYSSSNVTTGGPSLGTFNNQFNLKSSGTSGQISTLSFNIYDASGIDFADFISNSYGNYFVADILGSNGRTGLSGISCDPVVHGNTPEPSSLVLLGTGLLSAGMAARRRFTQAIAKA